MMRKNLFFLMLLVTGSASAEWKHFLVSEKLVVTVKMGGGSHVWEEYLRRNRGLDEMVLIAEQIPLELEKSLNEVMARTAAENGANFQQGWLEGNISASLIPDSSGVIYVTFGGLSYSVQNRYSGKKWGVVRYDCLNTTSIDNMLITAQYGAGTGQLTDKVGLNGTTRSSTDCDSNLGWILPFVGDKIIGKFERIADSKVVEGVNRMTAKLKDSLFFARDQNWQVGLNKLIPVDRTIRLPDGSNFPIGQYVQTNLSRLIAESRMNVRVGRGPEFKAPPGDDPGGKKTVVGELLDLDVTMGNVNFSVNLSKASEVRWVWECPPDMQRCPQPW